jgi:hypothetical protein
MKVNKLLAFATICVLVVLGVLVRSYEQRLAQMQSAHATSSPAETPRLQVAALAATLGAASQQRRAAGVAAPAAAAESGSAPEPEDDGEASRERQAAHVDSVFAGQAKAGAGWAHDSERTLAQALRQFPGGATLVSVECRSSLCRARLTHQDQQRFSEFIDHMIQSATATWKGAIYSSRDAVGADGVIRNSIYFSKEGTEIPTI